MRRSVIIGLLLLTAGLFGVATTLNIIISHAMAQGYEENYYGDDSYSTYPTDDKKYECRTGPFEGFFVSSVEFCKHVKFVDKDDSTKDHSRDIKTGPPSPSSPSNNNSTFVNTLNCENTNNIKINTETNKSSTSGLQPIQDSDAQGLDGNLDGLLN
jgi:hypothetical protein